MKRFILITFVTLSFSILSLTAYGQKPTRIAFKSGATTTVASGSLSDQKYHRAFVIKVKAGQTLTTESVGTTHPITIVIKQPDGSTFDEDLDLSCHSRREVKPTVAGDYQLFVRECNKADVWKGTFKFKVTVR